MTCAQKRDLDLDLVRPGRTAVELTVEEEREVERARSRLKTIRRKYWAEVLTPVRVGGRRIVTDVKDVAPALIPPAHRYKRFTDQERKV